MRCTERRRWAAGVFGPGLLLAVCGCSPTPAPPPSSPPAGPVAADRGTASPPRPAAPAEPAPVPAPSARAIAVPLPPPKPVGTWDELRRQAAHRIVAANAEGTYLGTVPDSLLAIPVLEIELKRDGSIARVIILRAPRQARDTSALAIAAVHRAAPFGDVSRLPRPWRFTETFLFNDERKFKPRTLDE